MILLGVEVIIIMTPIKRLLEMISLEIYDANWEDLDSDELLK